MKKFHSEFIAEIANRLQNNQLSSTELTDVVSSYCNQFQFSPKKVLAQIEDQLEQNGYTKIIVTTPTLIDDLRLEKYVDLFGVGKAQLDIRTDKKVLYGIRLESKSKILDLTAENALNNLKS